MSKSVKVKIFCDNTVLPVKATKGSSGYDLRATDDFTIKGFDPEKGCTIDSAKTGIYMEIPIGYQVNILPKSGLAKQGLMVVNSPGLIDSDFRKQFEVLFLKITAGDMSFAKGHKIAQMTITETLDFDFEQVSSVEELSKTDRIGGFGSTGLK